MVDFLHFQDSLEITESHVVISVQKNVSCNLRHLFMAIVCAFGRIGTKLLLWIPGVEFYCKLESGAHYNHANMVFINFFFLVLTPFLLQKTQIDGIKSREQYAHICVHI